MGVALPPQYPGHIADGTVWDINSTCAEFSPKCLHIFRIQHLMVSDTKSYLYGKHNVSVLKTLRAGDFSRLSTAFRERDDTCEQVMEAEQRTKTKLPRAIQEIAMAMRLMVYLR